MLDPEMYCSFFSFFLCTRKHTSQPFGPPKQPYNTKPQTHQKSETIPQQIDMPQAGAAAAHGRVALCY